jgi:PAS domain S-box-containing protein
MIILSGHVVARAVYFFEVINPIQSDMRNIPLGITFSILMYAILLYRFQLFNPIPLAQKTMIEQMPSGMLVLDLHGRIIHMNPSAEQILAIDNHRARGRRIEELVSAYQHVLVKDQGETEIEFSIRTGQDARHYIMRLSSLTDWRGMEVGRLLMLLDQTERRKVQAQLLDHQRSLAIQQERERLARELHDSLGQMLAAIHLQVSAARLFLDQGKNDQTKAGLQTLSEMTVLAESELREYLLGVKTAFSTDAHFFTALRHYIQSFRHQYDIQVELCVPPELEAQGLNPQVEVQLLRIIQESLSNIRKHAQTRTARVDFACTGSQVQVMISDNGRGFDLREDELRLGDRFGLRSMRDRAEEIGGYVEITSHPDKGTQVVVFIPRETENETHHKNPEVIQ